MRITRNTARPPAGLSAYAPDSLPSYRGGSAGGIDFLDPDTLFTALNTGDYYDFVSLAGKWQNAAGDIAVTSSGDVMARMDGQRTLGATAALGFTLLSGGNIMWDSGLRRSDLGTGPVFAADGNSTQVSETNGYIQHITVEQVYSGTRANFEFFSGPTDGNRRNIINTLGAGLQRNYCLSGLVGITGAVWPASTVTKSYSFMTSAGGTFAEVYEDGVFIENDGGTNTAWDFIRVVVDRMADGSYVRVKGMVFAEAPGDATVAIGLHNWGLSL